MRKRVLFVCIHNSCRSQMAEGLARHLGGDFVEAHSAGSAPCGEVDAGAFATLREIGIDISSHTSKSLNDIPQVEYDFVATMGCDDACPMVRTKRREDWGIADPKGKEPEDYQVARDTIQARVKQLLTEIRENESP